MDNVTGIIHLKSIEMLNLEISLIVNYTVTHSNGVVIEGRMSVPSTLLNDSETVLLNDSDLVLLIENYHSNIYKPITTE